MYKNIVIQNNCGVSLSVTSGIAWVNPIAATPNATIVVPNDDIILSTNENNVPSIPGTNLPERYVS